MPKRVADHALDEELGDSPPARKVVTRSPPHTVRSINLPHLQKIAIEAESSPERDFIYRTLGFPFLRTLKHQPFTLELSAGTYTPDFLVGFADGSKAVAEVKPANKVERFKEKFAQATIKLAEHSMPFLVVRDILLRDGDVHERAWLIRRYAKGSYPESEKALVIEALQGASQGLSLKVLLARGVQRATLLQMVAHQQLQVSSDLDISDSATVRLPQPSTKEGSHAIRFASWLGA